MVKFLDKANMACRNNNKTICERAEEKPAKGGNIEQLKLIVGSNQESLAEEASYFNYEGDQAEELLAILLI